MKDSYKTPRGVADELIVLGNSACTWETVPASDGLESWSREHIAFTARVFYLTLSSITCQNQFQPTGFQLINVSRVNKPPFLFLSQDTLPGI